ncbi:MAG: helix-turn-helix domain-containing protein [Candidatus Dormibacteraceae bacterium]
MTRDFAGQPSFTRNGSADKGGNVTSEMDQERIPVTVGTDNVFADLGFPNPEEEQMKARLAYQIMLAIRRLGLSQSKAARLLGVSQPNVSNLARGHYEDFSIDRLIRFLKTLGSDVEVSVKPRAAAAFNVPMPPVESQGVGASLAAEEAAAVAFHEQTCSESDSIWRDGLNILLRGFDPIHGRIVEKEDETVLLALLMRAWQTIYRARDSALKGYYPQALSLLRSPIEDWLAYWYIRSFPARYKHFVDESLRTPVFNDMLQKIEARHFKGEQNRVVREWIKRLHRFSHVDRAGLRMVFLPSQTGAKLLLGPDRDAEAFHYCSAEAVLLIQMHLEALDNLRKLFGLPGLTEFDSFKQRLQQYQELLVS